MSLTTVSALETVEVMSPPPIKIGEFDVEAANSLADQIASRWVLPMKLPNSTGAHTETLDMRIDDNHISLFGVNGYSPQIYVYEDGETIEDRDILRWHCDADKYTMEAIAFAIGSTLRNPDMLAGKVDVPELPTVKPGALLTMLTRNYPTRAQEIIEGAVAKGDLAPVEGFDVGDILLIPKNGIHRRAQSPADKSGPKYRVVTQQYI